MIEVRFMQKLKEKTIIKKALTSFQGNIFLRTIMVAT